MDAYKYVLSITDPIGYPTAMGIWDSMDAAVDSLCMDGRISRVVFDKIGPYHRCGIALIDGEYYLWAITAMRPSAVRCPIFELYNPERPELGLVGANIQ